MNGRTLRLSASDRLDLVAGAAALGIGLDDASVSQLARFADLLDVWSPRVNLLSCGSGHELVERHFLDSLSLGPLLPETGTVVDLGTGAGLPGIPLAILKRDQPFVLVEVRRRRATFLREVRRTLQLANVEILEQRAENPPDDRIQRAEAVVTRAVWADEAAVAISARWLIPTGRLFWMRGDPLLESTAPTCATREERFQYRIGRGRLRTVEVFKVQ